MRPPVGLPPYLASLYTIPLLTREQEQYWFRKMNYLKYRAAGLQNKIDLKRPKQVDLDALEKHVAGALQISVASVSRELGVAEGILHNWKKAKLAKSSSAEQEVLELKKRLKEVEMENEILKKAALIFGRAS